MPMVDALLPEFDHEMTTTRQAARARAGRSARVEAAREVDVARRTRDAPVESALVGPGDAERTPSSTWRRSPSQAEATSRAQILDDVRSQRRGDARRADRQERRGTDGAVGTEARRPDDLLDAEGVGLAIVRAQPRRPPPRSAERLPAAAGRPGPVDLRTERGRRRALSGW